MLPEELLKKVKKIEITTRKVVDDLMSGQYRSHFKGHGVQFSDHRIYMAGDDVRHIDWKASARSREPLLKKFEEERELTVLLVVDASGSEAFGSAQKLKSEVTAEMGAVLAHAAVLTGDKVGTILFSSEIEKIVPPKKGRNHVLRITRELLGFRPQHQGTNLAGALEAADRVLKHSGIVFILSDFLADGYEKQLRRLARRHDVVAVWIGDEKEKKLPPVGTFSFVDPETGQEALVDTHSYGFKKWFGEFQTRYEQGTEEKLKSGKVEVLRVTTSEDYGEALVRFFRARSRRQRR